MVLPSGRDLRFKKHAYFSLDENKTSFILIHYVGDENVAVQYPHGNSKNTTHSFYRTPPSVLHQLSSTSDLPSNVYKNAVSSNMKPLMSPRNSRQIINLQHKERQKYRMSHDSLYNLHELAYDLNGFVKVIKTYPDLVVVCSLDAIATEMNNVLQTKSRCPQLLSYDTTFQLGDFYVSAVLFRYTLFQGSPCIPAIFLIHERKHQSSHEELMRYIATKFPFLVNGNGTVPIVLDDEVGLQKVMYLD